MRLTNKQLTDALASEKKDNSELKKENYALIKSARETNVLVEELARAERRLSSIRLALRTMQAVKFPGKDLQYTPMLEEVETEQEQLLFLRYVYSLLEMP